MLTCVLDAWEFIETVDQLRLLSQHVGRRGELVTTLTELLARFEAHERAESVRLQEFFLQDESAAQ